MPDLPRRQPSAPQPADESCRPDSWSRDPALPEAALLTAIIMILATDDKAFADIFNPPFFGDQVPPDAM
ncbi:hypothetical protein [Endozoicomonas sp. ONNA2]|uniref:hypothetical protein n=1 Tax=Endozoicomonas sp. ONNA2 TaxID=2828741 RepID=UPI0021485D18|nr:hypothetical protein [Endozoicomonas sp. ONNA2]